MASFSTISLDEARRAVLPPRRATQEQYREYVRGLVQAVVGRLDLEPEDRPITERARLKAAAKAEGVHLEMRRRGNTIVFYKTNVPVPTRSRAKSGNGRRRGR